MEPAEFEQWGRAVVDRAAALILAEVPTAQQPEAGKTARRVSAGRGYLSHYVHFLQPDRLAQRAVWLFAVPAGHPYDFTPPHDRVGAGLMQDSKTELSTSRFAAGLGQSNPFAWKTHIDTRYEGYRLGLKVTPSTEAPEEAADQLASRVLHGLRRAGLL